MTAFARFVRNRFQRFRADSSFCLTLAKKDSGVSDSARSDVRDSIVSEYWRIREGDEYTGYRVSLLANYPPMAVPLKLDITTGDKITPKEIEYRFKLLLEDRSISVFAYNLETICIESDSGKTWFDRDS